MLPILRTRTLRPVTNQSPWDIFDRFLDDFGRDPGALAEPLCGIGSADVYEDESNLHVEVALPGFGREQINLVLEDGVLHVRAERSAQEEKDRKYHVRERALGKWVRSFRLPVAVQEENVEANFNDGILKISLEKRDQKKSHQIEVK